VALWRLLRRLEVRPVIVNPTGFPARFDFLLADCPEADKSKAAVRHLERADAIVVLDIADLSRLGHLARVVERTTVPVACVDHHASDGSLPDGPRLVDSAAAATGELTYDLARSARWQMDTGIARALYVAILTDTGGFRFSNTSARVLQLGAHFLEHGLDPEAVYTAVYGSEPEGKVRVLSEALETLIVEGPIAWLTIPLGALERHALDASDLDGIVEVARSIRGVQLAILFRQLANGRIKVSFRSVGAVDVARLAERFGGGGHRRAAGASLAGSLAEVQAQVLAVARTVARTS
jgi:phosphoesterase RecJ-like protein